MDDDSAGMTVPKADGVPGGIERLLDALCLMAILALAAVTTVDVIGRYGFNAPLQGAYESSELLLAVLVFAALPSVTWHRQHLMVCLMDGVLGERGKQVQRVGVSLLTALALGILAVFLWQHADQLAEYGDMSNALQLPLAPFAHGAAVLTGLSALAALLGVKGVKGVKGDEDDEGDQVDKVDDDGKAANDQTNRLRGAEGMRDG